MPGGPLDPDLVSLWERVRGELRTTMPRPTFTLWFEPLRVVGARGSTLYLSAPDSVRVWVERRYLTRLAAALDRHSPDLRWIEFVGREDEAEDEGPSAPPAQALDPGHTFERFVIGPQNRLAHAASLAVAELPGEAYNPLFLHGPPGLGKTHLMGAIAEYLHRNRPSLTIHYTTAERFTSEFVGALRHEGPERFKRRYRELDALLIDDVQVLEGKERTEEEFVHTFNALHAAGKQIVLSSDRPPAALSRLAERVRDRFQWGLTVELSPPDLRTRIALLWRMAAGSSPELSEPAVLRDIASRAPTNVRLLEGAMTRVVALASVLSEPISPPLVRRALEPGRQDPAPAERQEPTIEAIQDAVCTVLDVRREDLLSASRTPRIARARQLAMYLARDLTALSLARIARDFDRDHSTVLHAIRSINQRLEPGSETANAIHRVRENLRTTGDGDLAKVQAAHDGAASPQP